MTAQQNNIDNYVKPESRYAWGQRQTGQNVYEAALDRIRHTLDAFDNFAVSFSGGKDSMAVLETVLTVAREKGATPVTVVFCDEEALEPPTEEYIRRVSQRSDVDFHWLAIPVRHRNGASTDEGNSEWYPWAPEDRERWIRPLPEGAVTLEDVSEWYEDPRGLDGKGEGNPLSRPSNGTLLQEYVSRLFPTGSIANLLGIRADESLTRRKAVAHLRDDAYIIPQSKRSSKVYPIYDWTDGDVWTAADMFEWDYNETYDYLEMVGVSRRNSRVGPPFGYEALASLRHWPETWPETWNRMAERVPGASTAVLYAHTDLYGYGKLPEKPEGQPWPEFIKEVIESHRDEVFRKDTYARVEKAVKGHYRRTKDPLLYDAAHPASGMSWKLILRIAQRGDQKSRIISNAGRGSPEKYREALKAHREKQKEKRRKK